MLNPRQLLVILRLKGLTPAWPRSRIVSLKEKVSPEVASLSYTSLYEHRMREGTERTGTSRVEKESMVIKIYANVLGGDNIVVKGPFIHI